MQNSEHTLGTDGVVGPFLASVKLSDGRGGSVMMPIAVSPVYTATNENNPNHWTVVINRHTQAEMERTLSASVSEIEGLTPDQAAQVLHTRFEADLPRLRDEYNQHGYALSNVRLAVPETSIAVDSAPKVDIGVQKLAYDVEFSHTHTPDIAPEAAWHSHDVELGVLLRSPDHTPVALTTDMKDRLEGVIGQFFNGGNDFSNTTLEAACEKLYGDILETLPELAPDPSSPHLHGISMAIDYDGSLDHPTTTTDFIRTFE